MIKKNKGLSAYMTVEASLLFPMVVFMLVIILYLILFKYNEVTVFQNAAIAALYGKDFSYTDEKKEELTQRIYGILEKLNDNQFLAISALEKEVKLESNDIIICQSGSMEIPFFSGEMENELSLSEKVIVDTKNYIFYIRQMRKVRENDN